MSSTRAAGGEGAGVRPAATPSQTIGPFFQVGMDWMGSEDMVDPGSPGVVGIQGQVFDGAGEPIPDALIEFWQADRDGRFGAAGSAGFGRSLTDEQGRYRFTTIKPGSVAGADGRAQAPHIDVTVFARGLLQRLVTRLYFPDEQPANAADPVLGLIGDPAARATLIARPEPSGGLRFDIHLQGAQETVFFAY